MKKFTQEMLKQVYSRVIIDFTVVFRRLCRDTYIEVEGRKDDYFRVICYFSDGTQTETFSQKIPSTKRREVKK